MKTMWTKQRRLEWQREHRRKNNNSDTKKYEKTIKGFLMRLYRNMQSRITGVQKVKFHLYNGKKLLDRNEFYDWSITNKKFLKLWKAWVANNYDRKLTPSVDRVDSDGNYEISNMEWVTNSENSRRGALSTKRRYSPNYDENHRS